MQHARISIQSLLNYYAKKPIYGTNIKVKLAYKQYHVRAGSPGTYYVLNQNEDEGHFSPYAVLCKTTMLQLSVSLVNPSIMYTR